MNSNSHVQSSYVEVLIEALSPELCFKTRQQILSRVPMKFFKVPSPVEGVRQELQNCNVGPKSPGFISCLSREEAIVLALIRFDDGSLDFSQSLLYITSHVPPNRISITVPPLHKRMGSMVPRDWFRPFEPNELCLLYSCDDKHESTPHLHFCCMQMAQNLPGPLVQNVRRTMMEQCAYSNVVESKGGSRRSYHCFGVRPCFLASGGIGTYCLDKGRCQGLSASEVAAMQDSWFCSYNEMNRFMLNAVAHVNESLAASQLSHMQAHHLNGNGIRLLHGWASTLFNTSTLFNKDPHIEEERDCFQALGFYLQSTPKTRLPAVGEVIEVEVQEPMAPEGEGPIVWKTAKVLQHLSALSFKACINDDEDFLQVFHQCQERVEWRRHLHHSVATRSAPCPWWLSNVVLLDSKYCARVLYHLGAADPDSLLIAGAVCTVWRRCFYFGRFVSYACGLYMERACTRWVLMRGEDCHGTEAGPTYQPPHNTLCMPVLGLLAHTAKQVVCRSHAKDRRSKNAIDDSVEEHRVVDSARAETSGVAHRARTPHHIIAILDHHVYGGAKVGSLRNVYVRVRFVDGSTSGKAYFPADTLSRSTVLEQYVQSRRGKAIKKYCPPSAGDK